MRLQHYQPLRTVMPREQVAAELAEVCRSLSTMKRSDYPRDTYYDYVRELRCARIARLREVLASLPSDP